MFFLYNCICTISLILLLFLDVSKVFVKSHSLSISSLVASTTAPSSCYNNQKKTSYEHSHRKKLVLLLDVDNTLYSEAAAAIESQIIRNIHAFCQRHLNYTQDYCDQLHKKHGSTVEGIRHNLQQQLHDTDETATNSTNALDYDILNNFYNEVYSNIDVTPLLRLSKTSTSTKNNTGYLHHDTSGSVFPLAEFLQSLSCPVYLVSNSPFYHVHKVISALGMHKCNFAGILSPDSSNNNNNKHLCFPTKSSANIFYESLLQAYPLDQYQIVLLDDSPYNIQKASECGIHGILISHDEDDNGITLELGLGFALQHNNKNKSATADELFNNNASNKTNNNYKFADTIYLHSKNELDAESINEHVWNRLSKEVSSLDLTSSNGALYVADIGCGLLSMLQYMLNGVTTTATASALDDAAVVRSSSSKKGKKQMKMPSMVDNIPNLKEIHYYAYELNANLLHECQNILLQSMGLVMEEGVKEENEYIFSKMITKNDNSYLLRVYLRFQDFTTVEQPQHLHLLIGCCFADLFNPEILSKEILRFTTSPRTTTPRNNDSSVLIYLPLTHAGTTSFVPPSPVDAESNIPSDTIAFRYYSQSLAKRHGQCIMWTTIVDEIEKVGGRVIAKGSSNWFIDPIKNFFLWETLLFFFEKCALPEMALSKWNANEWIKRARNHRPSIHVSNVDFLFRLHHPSLTTTTTREGKYETRSKTDNNINNIKGETVSEIVFVSPGKIEVVEKKWNPLNTENNNDDDDVVLGPDQVEIESICSLISSGTELKIFNGLFEAAQPLDVSIEEMKDSTMAYPLKYGYSLVGRVRRCGSNVDSSIVGELAFTFSYHASRAIVHKDSIHLVPSGIAPEDAIFFPSVETAISIIHDVNLRVGENVAVFGQGLIGLLVTIILCSVQPFDDSDSSIIRFGKVTVFDTIPDRLAIASLMGASEALLPPSSTSNAAGSLFDVCIEVSGNERALQSAIDNACDGGRVIMASWYGNREVRLRLGTAFHRSHKSLIVSQVSEIPAHLRMTWTKPRRFALTWEILRKIRPSKHLLTKTVSIHDAQEAYELLDTGKEISVAIKY